MDSRKQFEQWQARIRFIKGEYPFGSLQEFRNELGQLHSVKGPAYISSTRCIWYENGRKHGLDVDVFGSITYWYNGVMVPRDYVTKPETLQVEEILKHPNNEVRYAGIRIIGFNKVLANKNVKMIENDKEHERMLFEVSNVFQNPFRVVKVFNSTPEIDGTSKEYFLIVPATIKTCQEAVAWTFKKEANEYKPEVET